MSIPKTGIVMSGGKQLGVRYVLEGSVQREQNRVRVNAQLIDAKSGAHLWAERFEEDIAACSSWQDQIVVRQPRESGGLCEVAGAEIRSPRKATSHKPD